MSAAGLLALSRALHRATDLERVLSEVRRACMAHTRYDRVYIQLPSADRSSMEVVGYVLPDSDLVKQHVSHMDLRDDPFMQKVFDPERVRGRPGQIRVAKRERALGPAHAP